MNRRFKVAFIISNLSQGGAERQFFELVKNIDKNLFEVTLCLYAVNKGVFFEEIENISEINLVKKYLHNKNPILKISEALIFLYTYLKKNDFDLIHTSLFMNGALIRFVSPRKYKNKIVYNVRTSFNLYTRKLLLIERLLISKSYLITNSKKAYGDFVKFIPSKFKNRIDYIYNGFDTNKFNPDSKINNEKIIIGSVGRIHQLKNQLQILRVFKELISEKLELIIVGNDGGEKKIIDKFIIDNNLTEVAHIFSQQKNIEDYYRKFDIFILSSILEGCPNVLFEAMLSKCFCIISKNANSDDFVIDGKNGLVYDGTDTELKTKLEYAIAIKGTDKYEKIREEGYNYATNNFSMEKMVRSYEHLYFNLVNGNRIK